MIILPGSSDIGGSSGPLIIPMPFTWDTTAAGYAARAFGMFIHFNMATFQDLEFGDATASPNVFNPGSTCDVQQWVDVAVAAKAHYACLTVKHVDGFCLWPTSLTAHTVSNGTWYNGANGFDIVDRFVTKFKAARIVPVLYYCIWDTYYELTQDPNDSTAMLAYHQPLITEVVQRYGAVAGVWLDGTEWHYPGHANGYPWASSAARAAFFHGLQSGLLLINNSHTFADSDVIEYENNTTDIPPGNTTPAEFCEPLRGDGNWFFKTASDTPKTSAYVISQINKFNARTGSYLLNCGPNTQGLIPSEMVTVMTAVGAR